MRKTERAQSRHAEGVDEGDVEVLARVGAQSQEHLDGGLGMAHLQGDWERAVGQRDLGALSGRRRAAAGVDGHRVDDSLAAVRVDEFEMGGHERDEGSQEDN